ncbi:MAG: transcription termination factor NusA [Gammaproteobacteria bacterium]|nr:transcription termination factor NusA [Gammaproteobacteria bacterium]
MSKELLLVVEAVANEKDVDRDVIFDAMEQALAMATKKRHGIEMDVRVELNRKTGEYLSYRRWFVLADDEALEDPLTQIDLSEAQKEHTDATVGEFIETLIPSIEFGRIAAQTARSVIMQKIREAERDKLVALFKGRIGELIFASVKRVTRDLVVVDLGEHAEGIMPRTEMIPREVYKVGDRVRAYLKEVSVDQRGHQIILSRTCPEMLIELMRLEIPEVAEQVIEIKKAVRDPGMRAKVAVKTYDSRVDPVGACVGMRGSRIQAVTNELAGERIDVIVFDDNPVQFVMNALAPAEIVSVIMDEENHVMDVAVPEDQLSLAIGRGGQNVRLAGQLTGWRLNVMAENDAAVKEQNNTAQQRQELIDALGIDEEVADLFISEGFVSLEEIAYVPVQELLDLQVFDEDVIMELRDRAKNALLARALTGGSTANLDPQILELEGMTESLAMQLFERDITTREELAEQAVDDLIDMPHMTEELAGKMIMAARKHWFE